MSPIFGVRNNVNACAMRRAHVVVGLFAALLSIKTHHRVMDSGDVSGNAQLFTE